MNININGVNITLTKEQLAEIAIQTRKFKYNHYTDIKTIEDALDYLNLIPTEDRLSTVAKIQIVAKAINKLIDNSKINTKRAYFPYYEKKSSDLVFLDSSCYSYYHYGPVTLIKTKEACNYFGEQFIHLYQQLEKEYE